jgi:hypothetical protein
VTSVTARQGPGCQTDEGCIPESWAGQYMRTRVPLSAHDITLVRDSTRPRGGSDG